MKNWFLMAVLMMFSVAAYAASSQQDPEGYEIAFSECNEKANEQATDELYEKILVSCMKQKGYEVDESESKESY